MTQPSAFEIYRATARKRRDRWVARWGNRLFKLGTPEYQAFLNEIVQRGLKALDEDDRVPEREEKQ